MAFVYIVDDDSAVCQSMGFLLKSVGLEAKEYTSPELFLKEFREELASCIILDVRMPGLSGLELQKSLNDQGINTPIIFLTSHHDIITAVKAIKAGAVDFLTKPFSDQQLLDVVQGAIAKHVETASDRVERQSFQTGFKRLTDREHQVLTCIINGLLNKQIAEELKISTKTVELHRSNLMKKLKAKNLADLVRMVMMYREVV